MLDRLLLVLSILLLPFGVTTMRRGATFGVQYTIVMLRKLLLLFSYHLVLYIQLCVEALLSEYWILLVLRIQLVVLKLLNLTKNGVGNTTSVWFYLQKVVNTTSMLYIKLSSSLIPSTPKVRYSTPTV